MQFVLLLCAVSTLTSFVSSTDEIGTDYAASNRQFTVALYKELKSTDGNFLASPISAQIVLSLALTGAANETAAQLSRALRLPADSSRVQSLMRPVIESLASTKQVRLSSANKMFLDANIDVKPSFAEVASTVYRSPVEKVRFVADKDASVAAINNWVASQTNNKIREIVTPDRIDSDTRMVLVNALYFSGKWEYPFEPYETRKLPFHLDDQRVIDVEMMGVIADLPVAVDAELDATFLKLPYEKEEASMVIVVPNKPTGIRTLEANVEKLFAPRQYAETKVLAYVPKFSTESTIELVPILRKWGVSDAFEFNANFSGISESPLKISDIVQKTYINVDENGTEAASATSVTLSDRIAAKAIKIVADRPFIYYLQTKDGQLLFVGRKCN